MPSAASAARASMAIGTSEPVAISVAWRGAVGLGEDVAAAGAAVLGDVAALRRQRLAGQHQQAGAVGAADRQLPALRGFQRVGRAEHVQVRHGAQAGEVLDRLVGRAVLAQADRIVGQHVDHPLAHQRGQPDRRAHVVGEDEERAGVGDQPAVQRHAVGAAAMACSRMP